MKKIISIAILMVFALGLTAPALSAQQAATRSSTKIEVPLEEMDEYTRNKLLEYVKKQKKLESKAPLATMDRLADNMTPERMEAWGKLVAGGLKTFCDTLSIEVNKFVETKVGMVVTGLIAYHILGDDVRAYLLDARAMLFSVVLWLVGMPVILWSYTRFHVPKKVKIRSTDNWNGKGKPPVVNIEFKKRYDFSDDACRVTSAVFHVLLFFFILMLGFGMLAGC